MTTGRHPDEGWMERSRCRGSPTEVFFPAEDGGLLVAQQICAACAVQVDCLEYAIANRIEHGVWGGVSERGRRRIRSAREQAGRRAS